MLFMGKLKMICLLMGLLTIGEIGAQVTAVGEAVPQAEAEREEAVQEDDSVSEGQNWTEEYERLLAEKEELKKQLQEKEAALSPEDVDGQIEVMDLQEAVRAVQLQIISMRADMEETF